MPADHQLGEYQRRHRLYDRFLPHLASYLPVGSAVVDVGANCGDTLAAMATTQPNLHYVCIEPDDAFFALLQENARRIRAIEAEVSVRVVKSLIGQAVNDVSLAGCGGTKKAVLGETGTGALKSIRLDDTVMPNEAKALALIKSDVDGFDFDVLDSSSSLIAQHHPLLFFECQLDHDFQKAGYENTLTWLSESGYDCWVAFDNFGEVILQTSAVRDVVQLLDYVWRQNTGRTSRTIHYIDLLGATGRHHDMTYRCVRDYLNFA